MDDVAFRFLAADQGPDYRSIARFRLHLDAVAELFSQCLHLARRLGMVKMGRVAVDGTKLKANTSKYKAMSYGRLTAEEEHVEAEITELEAKATAFTLVRGGAAVVPHVIGHEQLGEALEDVDQGDGSVASDERSRRVHLGHGQPSPYGGDRVALPGVRLLPASQSVDCGQPLRAGGDRRRVHCSHVRTDPATRKNSSFDCSRPPNRMRTPSHSYAYWEARRCRRQIGGCPPGALRRAHTHIPLCVRDA